MKKINFFITLLVAVIVGACLAIFLNTGSNDDNKISQNVNGVKLIKVGIMNGRIKDDQTWQIINQKLKTQNIQIELKRYDDYEKPNEDLKNGKLDLNAFQHESFLDDWNKRNGGDLIAIGETYLSPLRLYSSVYKDVSEIPPGTTIRVPNDKINQSRGLRFLENLGLITFKINHNKGNKELVSVGDISKNERNLNIQALPIEQLLAKYGTGITVAITTDDYAKMANLSVGDVISVEKIDSTSRQWINVISTRKRDKNNSVYKKIVEAYQSPEVAEAMEDDIGRYQIPAWDDSKFSN